MEKNSEHPAKLKIKDLFSLASAALGLLVILIAFGAMPPYFPLLPLDFAALAILLSAVLDYFDGKLARAEHEANPFGKELDSLCDAVAFGVAPAAYAVWAIPQIALVPFGLGYASLFAYLLAALVRLAWFNVQEDHTHYYGLIVPVAAVFVVLSVWLLAENAWIALFVIAALMLSRFKWKKPL
ncbi:MAG: CDP-alcohol phosphatidyltransferase family protein [Candidatus Micrarchaeota archaeon]